jgi:hypothetical protein
VSLTEAGVANFRELIAGAPAALSAGSAHAYVGVGSDPAPNPPGAVPFGTLAPVRGEGPGQTHYQVADEGFPRQAGDLLQVQVTVSEEEACFPWNEWGIVLTPARTVTSSHYLHALGPGTVLVNRKAVSLGVKQSGTSWAFTFGLRLVAV